MAFALGHQASACTSCPSSGRTKSQDVSKDRLSCGREMGVTVCLVNCLQNSSNELQQVQAKVSSNEGILKDCNKELILRKSEMDDLRVQLKQGLDRVYGQVSVVA